MAPLNSHFDGTRQRDEPTIFSEIRGRTGIPPWGINSSWLAASKEKWTLRISMARTRYFPNAFRPFSIAPRPPRARARDLSVAINEKKNPERGRQRDRSVFIHLNRAHRRIPRSLACAPARRRIETESKPIDLTDPQFKISRYSWQILCITFLIKVRHISSKINRLFSIK